MEEFNEIFYVQLTDDQNFLAMAKNHFSDFLNDPTNGILTTPLKNKQKNSPFLEEEKSTLDTNANNKFSNILSEVELMPHEVDIHPFNKFNEAIEEENEDKSTSKIDQNAKNDRIGDGQMEIDNDVISHLLSKGKI